MRRTDAGRRHRRSRGEDRTDEERAAGSDARSARTTRSASRDRPESERRSDPGSRSDPVGALHAAVGNQAVGDHAASDQLVEELHERGALQAKLAVSQPDDAAEREAERVADEVLTPSSADERDGNGEPLELQRSADSGGGESVSGDHERQLRSSLSGGRPLPSATQSFFEERFGRDFSDVRVHTGPEAGQAAQSIDAEAFTLGTDIAFAPGAYQPETSGGKQLLAHELTHVAQQDSGATERADRQGSAMQRPERGASVAEVQSYLACNVCRAGQYGRCARDLSERALRVVLAAGWRPDVHVSIPMANAAETIVAVDEQVAHDDAIQTYIKVEYLVENADVIQGHMGDNQLSYPGERPEFNTLYEQLGTEVVKTVITGLLPLSDAAGFALDVGMAIYNSHIADEDLREDAIRDTIIHRLDDELDEDIPQLYNEGARAHYSLKERRDFAREWLWDLPGTERGYDGPQLYQDSPFPSLFGF